MKEKFYVFLDIDGVLWDWSWRISEVKSGRVRGGGIITDFNPASVETLNNLIRNLSEKYDCKLVISSSWRVNMTMTEKALRKNHILIPNDKLDRTPLTIRRGIRAEEIIAYLFDKENRNNYVIIDDETFNFETYFDPSHIIKTDIYAGSLCQEHIEKWKEANGLIDTPCNE